MQRMLAIVLLLLGAALAGCTAEPEAEEAYVGTLLAPGPPLEFTLLDETNASWSFNQTRGNITVLIFVFTNCPDICPLSTFKVASALTLIDPDINVSVVSISVDPWRDTPEAMAEYQRSRNVTWPHVTELVGDNETPQLLPAVWARNFVGVDIPETETGPGSSENRDDWEYDVAHGAPVILVDPSGMPTTALTNQNWNEIALIHDIELMHERHGA